MTDKKVHVSESGRAAAVQRGTTEREVHEALTGVDELPEKGMELGRPPGRPEFDPHVEPEQPVTVRAITLVFVGEGAGMEDRAREIMGYAEGKGFHVITAAISDVDEGIYWAVTGG